MEELKTAGKTARTVTIVAQIVVQRLEAIRCEPIGRPRARRMWLVMIAVICAGHLSGCSSDSAATKSANGRVDRTAESKSHRNHDQGAAVTQGTDQVSASDPSPSEPVTAAMVIRPENLSAGEAAELPRLRSNSRAHYVHAAKNPGEPWVPLAMNVSLPDGVEFSGDWQLPTPEKGHGDALVYRNSVLLRRALRVGPKSAPRDLRVSGKLRYQVCNDELCWPTRTREVSASLSIRDQAKLTHADELAHLKVLYIGTERASDYVGFLKGKVARSSQWRGPSLSHRTRPRSTSFCSTGRRARKTARCVSSLRRWALVLIGTNRRSSWARGTQPRRRLEAEGGLRMHMSRSVGLWLACP